MNVSGKDYALMVRALGIIERIALGADGYTSEGEETDMRSRKGNEASQRNARCSFCGKPREQVKRLIAGPGVTICDQCISIRNEILAGAQRGPDVPCRK